MIQSLDGNVYWENNQAIVHLDGEIAYFSNRDSLGSFIDRNGIMWVDDVALFATLRQYVDLGGGWESYIERDASNGKYKQKHAVIQKKGQVYAQNEDGSPHDKSKGSPPKSAKKKLNEKKK